MKHKLIAEIAGYTYATIDLYAATHSEFHRGQMLAYINTLDAVGGRAAKRLQVKLKHVYNDWVDALNKEAAQ